MQTATKLPAERIGVSDDLGTVTPGKLADLAFIQGDPLTNIDDLVRVNAVMKNGTYYPVSELTAPFAQPIPSVNAPPAAEPTDDEHH